MSRRFSAEWLDEITSAPMYLRRCNGLPEQGIRISGAGLRPVLACVTDVTTRDDGIIVWRGSSGEFTAEPVCDEAPTRT